MDVPGIKHRIIKHLPAYLLKHGSVGLAGLGRFRLDPRTSYVDHAASLVYPPYFDLLFEESQDATSNEYVAYLSNRLGLDDALISEIMVTHVSSILQSISHDEKVALDGLGELRLDDDTLSFSSDKQFWGMDAVANLAISFEPVPRIKEMAEKQPLTPLQPISPTPGEEDFLELKEDLVDEEWDNNLIDVDSFSEEGLEEDEMNEAPLEEVVVLQPETVAASYEMAADNTQTVAQHQVPHDKKQVITQNHSRNHRRIVPLMVGLLLLAIPLFWYLTRNTDQATSMTDPEIEIPGERLNKAPVSSADEIQEDAEPSQRDSNAKTSMSGSETLQSEDSSVSLTTTESEPSNKSTSQKPNENLKNSTESKPINTAKAAGQCVIIVGAFGEGPNMRNMMNRLEAKGFKVYIDSARTLSRVGIYSPCQSDQLNRNLINVQSEIEPNSWILTQE